MWICQSQPEPVEMELARGKTNAHLRELRTFASPFADGFGSIGLSQGTFFVDIALTEGHDDREYRGVHNRDEEELQRRGYRANISNGKTGRTESVGLKQAVNDVLPSRDIRNRMADSEKDPEDP